MPKPRALGPRPEAEAAGGELPAEADGAVEGAAFAGVGEEFAEGGLEKAGVACDPRGYIQVDDKLCTSIPGIWAVSDCNGRGAFTHTAYNDYEIVADNLLSGANRKVSDRIPIYGLFIDPPLGRLGLTETEARRAGHGPHRPVHGHSGGL